MALPTSYYGPDPPSHLDLTTNLLAKMREPRSVTKYYNIEIGDKATQTDISELKEVKEILRCYTALRAEVGKVEADVRRAKATMLKEMESRLDERVQAERLAMGEKVARLKKEHEERIATIRMSTKNQLQNAIASFKTQHAEVAVKPALMVIDSSISPEGLTALKEENLRLRKELTEKTAYALEMEEQKKSADIVLETKKAQILAYNKTLKNTLDTLAETVAARQRVPELEDQLRRKNEAIAQLVAQVNAYHTKLKEMSEQNERRRSKKGKGGPRLKASVLKRAAPAGGGDKASPRVAERISLKDKIMPMPFHDRPAPAAERTQPDPREDSLPSLPPTPDFDGSPTPVHSPTSSRGGAAKRRTSEPS